MDPVHLRLAEIGLRVAGRYGFALAGGYAVQVHGILDRPSEFAEAVDAVVDAFAAAGVHSRSYAAVRDLRPARGHRPGRAR